MRGWEWEWEREGECHVTEIPRYEHRHRYKHKANTRARSGLITTAAWTNCKRMGLGGCLALYKGTSYLIDK